jgi:hypothetical protein
MNSSQRILRRALALTLLASAALFAVGSHIERSKESASKIAAESSGAGKASAREPASRLRRDASAETGGAATLSREGASNGETHREASSAKAPRAEARTRVSEDARAVTAEPSAGETAAQLRSESRAAVGAASATAPRESARERRAERNREAKLLGINPEAMGLVIVAVSASVLLGLAIWCRRLAALLAAIAGFGLVFAALDVREVLHQVEESRANLIVIASVLIGLHLLVAVLACAGLLTARARRRRTADERPPLAV